MKIKKVSASEQVCEAIQDQISAGVWKVGDKLPSESDLAAKFGVNRLTVRMALQKLNAPRHSRDPHGQRHLCHRVRLRELPQDRLALL